MKGVCKKIVLLLLLSIPLISCSIIPDRFIIFKKPIIERDETFVATDDGDFFLAISVSGGGSRAAVWSSSVLSEIYRQVKLPDGRSILDEVDYISSVSGGSLSSAYYCMNKPTGDTTDTESFDTFFDTYTNDMRKNIEKEIVSIYKPWQWHRIFLRATDKGVILQKVIDDSFFNKSNFNDLYNRQRKGQCPTLIINGTVMDTGSKFLFTTLIRSNFTFETLSRTGSFEDTGIVRSNILLKRKDQGVTFTGDIGLSICEMRISKAVMASAGVPFLFGPVILKGKRGTTPKRSVYFHINDGGVADNLGLETVIQLMLQLFSEQGKKYRGGLVIIIDAAHPIDPEDSTGSIKGFTSMGTLSRSLDIFDYRHKYFAFYNILLIQQDPAFENIRFVYVSPYLVDDPEIIKKVKAVGTRFMIEPDHAANLDEAAKIVVGNLRERILLNFEGKDIPE